MTKHQHSWGKWWVVKSDGHRERMCTDCGSFQTFDRVVKAWAVMGTPSNKGGIEYENGYPMIFIQRTKPKVTLKGIKRTVMKIEIMYDFPNTGGSNLKRI